MSLCIDDALRQLINGQTEIKDRLCSLRSDVKRNIEAPKNETQDYNRMQNDNLHSLDTRLSILEKVKKRPGGGCFKIDTSSECNEKISKRFGRWVKADDGSQVWMPRRRVSSMRRVR